MAENPQSSELLLSFETPSGDVIRKIQFTDENGDLETQYRRASTTQAGKQGGTIISKTVGEQLENQAQESVGRAKDIEYIVTPKTNQDRERAIETRYENWEEIEGRDPSRIEEGQSRRESSILYFMQRAEIQEQIENDPLLQNTQERRRALESRAIQIADELEKAATEGQRIVILRQFGIDT